MSLPSSSDDGWDRKNWPLVGRVGRFRWLLIRVCVLDSIGIHLFLVHFVLFIYLLFICLGGRAISVLPSTSIVLMLL